MYFQISVHQALKKKNKEKWVTEWKINENSSQIRLCGYQEFKIKLLKQVFKQKSMLA